MANKNRIQPPSKIVHFFNTPPDLTEDTVNRVFLERGIEAPTTVKLFPLKSERSSSGLIEFSSVGIAVAAIMECNHTALENSSKYTPMARRYPRLCAREAVLASESPPRVSSLVSGENDRKGFLRGYDTLVIDRDATLSLVLSNLDLDLALYREGVYESFYIIGGRSLSSFRLSTSLRNSVTR